MHASQTIFSIDFLDRFLQICSHSVAYLPFCLVEVCVSHLPMWWVAPVAYHTQSYCSLQGFTSFPSGPSTSTHPMIYLPIEMYFHVNQRSYLDVLYVLMVVSMWFPIIYEYSWWLGLLCFWTCPPKPQCPGNSYWDIVSHLMPLCI